MFRFTIRDLLWLTALTAALAAWWTARLQSSPVLSEQVKVLDRKLEVERQKMDELKLIAEQQINRAHSRVHGTRSVAPQD